MPEGKNLGLQHGPSSKAIEENRARMIVNMVLGNDSGYRSNSTGSMRTEFLAGT